MTIQEAIKSGKPFKQTWWHTDYWLVCIAGDLYHEKEVNSIEEQWKNDHLFLALKTSKHYLMISDILSPDWEVKK